MLISEMETTAENLTSLLWISPPVNNLSLRGEVLRSFWVGERRGNQFSVTEYKGRTTRTWLQMRGNIKYFRTSGEGGRGQISLTCSFSNMETLPFKQVMTMNYAISLMVACRILFPFPGECRQARVGGEGKGRGSFLFRVSCVFASARLREKMQKQIDACSAR